MSHTPGPWVAEHNSEGTWRWHDIVDTRTDDPICIAQVYTRLGGEDFANARLIAAAPELLAMLERITIAYLGLAKAHGHVAATEWGECDEALELIAKAKGGAP